MSETARGRLLALALSAATTVAVGWPVLVRGETFVPTDFLEGRPPWSAHATDAFVKNSLHHDLLEFDAALAVRTGRELREGRLPLWNPDLLCGVPSVGDPQLGTFYPPRLLLLRLLPPFAALDALVLLHFFAAGLAMYALGRTWKLGVPASLLAALVWQLCGSQMVWLKYAGGGPAAAGLPLLAAALQRGLDGRSPAWIAAAGAAWALMLTGAHPQLSFLGLVWAAVALGAAARREGRGPALRSAACFAIAGAGLAAVQLLPFLAGLAESQKTALQDSLVYARPARTPLLLATLVWQRAFGSPIDRVDFVTRWTGSNFFEFQGYVGLLPLVFAVAGAKRSRLLSGLALSLLALAVCYPLWWLVVRGLPFLSVLNPHRLYLYSFAVALLAGLGCQAWLERPPSRPARVGLAGAALAVAIGAVGTLLGATWISLGNPAYAAFAAAATGAALALLALRSPLPPGLRTAALLGAVAVDLLPGFLAYNPGYRGLPAEPEAIRRLSRERRALIDLPSPYWNRGADNLLLFHGVASPSGYVSQYPRRTMELARALGARVGDRRVTWNGGDDRVLRALDVGTVIDARGERRLEPLPRAWLVERAELRPDAADRLARLGDPAFDFERVAVVESPVPGGLRGGRVTPAGPDRYVTEADGPALLVASETWDAGWTVEVDGQARPLLRADHAWRAVALDPGRHEVRFRYRPRTVLWGAVGSGATALGLAAFLLLRRRRPPPG
jgi:hypothetical protein